MPTKRDDAAYKAAYHRWCAVLRSASQRDVKIHIKNAGLSGLLGTTLKHYEELSGRIDAATDLLIESGLCASVRDWHKKPAGDDLPDLPEIPW